MAKKCSHLGAVKPAGGGAVRMGDYSQQRVMKPVGNSVGSNRVTLLSACSTTASVFLVMAAYRMAAVALRMRARPLPATEMPTAAAWVQARFSGCDPTFHPSTTFESSLPAPPAINCFVLFCLQVHLSPGLPRQWAGMLRQHHAAVEGAQYRSRRSLEWSAQQCHLPLQ